MDEICVALDTEMTGTQPGTDEIIEIAAVKFRGDEVLDTFSQLVRPRRSVPLKITRLTGITPEMLQDAPRFREVGQAFATFLSNHALVGHSVGFDIGMLRAQGLTINQPVYDTFDLATLLLPQASVYALSALADYLHITHPDDHRALQDADVSRQVFLQLVRRLENMDLRELTEVSKLMEQTGMSSSVLFGTILQSRARRVWDKKGSEQKARLEMARRLQSGDDDGLPRRHVTPNQYESLRPTGNTHPLDPERITAYFAPDGLLAQQFPRYEYREQQARMAQQVTEAFNTGETLLVEAGTGTGKSMAYLIPAALFAVQRGERVVISTNTINLQDQLFTKDIPDVRRMLTQERIREGVQSTDDEASPLKAALLKGRSNYLCLKRYRTMLREENLQPHEARALLKVRLWLATTTTGDRSELLLLDNELAAWRRLESTPDTCAGSECRSECYFYRARRKADAAHLVVVNHALLLADIAAQSNVLPEYAHVIIDEAHNLEEVATDQFGFAVDQGALIQLLDNLYNTSGVQSVSGFFSEYPRYLRDTPADTDDNRERAQQIIQPAVGAIERARIASTAFFQSLHTFADGVMETNNGYDPRIRLTPALRKRPLWNATTQAWENLELLLNEIGDAIGKFESFVFDLEDAGIPEYEELRLRVETLRRECTDIRVQTGHMLHGDDDLICWLSIDQMRNTLSLRSAPLAVDELLQTQLFGEKETSILTSATLSVDEQFGYVKQRLGLVEPLELQLDSPFDYEQQALLYIPDDIPAPNQHGYQGAVEQAIIDLAIATEGRMLVLFTATSALRQTYQSIQEPLEEHEIVVLGQGIDGSRRSLLERFKEWNRTVLLGTSSFWEGVDIVGDALSALVIVKLPFSVPGDPIVAARSEQFSDPFGEYSVPQSILRFKQGFGRLIRSRTDHGLVVVLDKRLVVKNYGQKFLQSLPPTTVRRGALRRLPGLAARFLGKKA